METRMKTLEKVGKTPEAFSRLPASPRSFEPSLPPGRFGFSHVQQTAGNLAIQHMFQSGLVQAKLVVSRSDDPYEREADSMADRVLHMAEPKVQRKCAVCASGDPCPSCGAEKTVQMKETPGTPPHVTQELESSPVSLSSDGQPLPASVRAFFEPRLGLDLRQVRVHTGSQASEAARAIQAKAYTHGKDIVFGAGQYAPESQEGKRLLAHELTHVVQQNKVDNNSLVRQASTLIQRQGSPTGTLPALSPEELLNFLLNQRGFGTSQPGPPTIDPKGIGKPTGKGYQTYAAIQIVDKEGKQIKVSVGAYLSGGDLHGETQAINNLRNSLPEGVKLEGGKMMVAVEQLPCPNCDSSIKSFAKELGVSEYAVYVPQRESIRTPGQFVKPKTAATGAFQGGRGPTTARLLTSETLDVSSSASEALSAEAKAAAKSAIASLETDLKLLRVSSFLRNSLIVISGVLDILNAIGFFNMAESKLRGGAFILNDYLKKAQDINAKANSLDTEYPHISTKLTEMQPNLLKAIIGLSSLGQVILGILDFKILLGQMKKGLDERIKSIDAVVKEADAKKAAALKILEDPEASAAIAAVTFGTGELARLFAISQDLELISSNLSSALEKFRKIRQNMEDDVNFLQGWYDYFLLLCKGDPSCKEALNEGWYKVIIVSAKVPDSFWDTPDVYVSFPKNGLKTSVKDDTTTPVWNEVIGQWRIDRLDENITIQIYDYDPISADDLLGSFEANLKPSNPEGESFTLGDSKVSLTLRVERFLRESND